MTLTIAHFNIGRALMYAASIGLMLLGFCILLAFVGPIYIEPHFQHSAQMLMGCGLLCLFSGGYIMISSTGTEGVTSSLQEMKLFCAIVIGLAIFIIAQGFWRHFIP